MACHGPNGKGNPLTGYPSLRGQHAQYTATQLRLFRDGAVWGRDSEANAVMAGVAANLSDAEIEAVAAFIQGLY
jgi:cytochrome c553